MPTRAVTRLAEAIAAVDGRLVLVGDRAQLPSIDAGGAFASLVDRLGAVELTENRRQLDPIQARIADLLGDRRAEEALCLLDYAGGLNAHSDPDHARAALIADWAADAVNDPSRAVILAHDRADVAALNEAARQVMDDAGWLGPTRLTAAGREWAAGDRLVCRRNGGTVEHVRLGARSLVMRTDDGRRVELPADYLEHAHHGYAITGHAAQGVTVDRTYLLAIPDRGSAEWGYVVASRHRTELRIHTVEAEGGRAHEELARAWSTGRPELLAIDLARQGKTRSGPTIDRSLHRESRDILERER